MLRQKGCITLVTCMAITCTFSVVEIPPWRDWTTCMSWMCTEACGREHCSTIVMFQLLVGVALWPEAKTNRWFSLADVTFLHTSAMLIPFLLVCRTCASLCSFFLLLLFLKRGRVSLGILFLNCLNLSRILLLFFDCRNTNVGASELPDHRKGLSCVPPPSPLVPWLHVCVLRWYLFDHWHSERHLPTIGFR